MWRMNHLRHLFTELFDAADAGSGGGTGTGAGTGTNTGATGTTAATGTGTTTPAAGTGTTAAGTASPTEKAYTYKEDRSDWIPRHRLNETSGKVTTLQQQLDQAKAQVAALTGVSPSDPNAAKQAQVKQAFEELYPHLKPLLNMTAEQVNALSRAPEAASRFQTAEQRQWARQGTQALNAVYKDVAEAMGIEKLDGEQQSDLREAFSGWFRSTVNKELEASGGTRSATLERYENSDETLLKEFTTNYTKRWVDPARRTQTANTAARLKGVPNSGGRAQVTSIERPATFKSLDDRLDYAAKLATSRGHQFAETK